MELTVVNEDTIPHVFYIDGLKISTKVLRPGDSQVLTLYSKGEATYNCYDWGNNGKPLGQIRPIKVTMYE
jgi:hypothetical protein